MKYTARLTGNRRDISTAYPKALLIGIDPDSELGRDHCWVQITDELAAIQPRGDHKPIKVIIEANIVPYTKQGKSAETTLSIINIKRA